VSTPQSPYRNDIDALRERKESLEQELAHLRAQTTQLESLRAREAELAQELFAVDGRLRAGAAPKRALPMLDRVQVASPCNASWDDMVGDERVRFCLKCDKSVFNLSAMSREDAERLLEERASGELCVRYYQRADGTIMTSDCPVGVKKKRRKKLALAVAGAGAMALAATQAYERAFGEQCTRMGAVAATQGEMELATPPTIPTVMGTAGPIVNPPPPPPVQANPTPHVPPRAPSHVIMGRRVPVAPAHQVIRK
jgi:hypothetical protein